MKCKLKQLVKYKSIFFLTLPGILLVLTFQYAPLVMGFVLPFKNVNYKTGIWKSPWVGLDNFKFLFSSDAAWRITRNTVCLNFLFIITVLVLSIICALFLYQLSKRSVKTYQTVLFFPYFISWVVASYVVLALLDMDNGLLNSILKFFGQEPILWYNEPKYWPVIMVIANLWKNVGYYTIIYYTGLLGINEEYYEAAQIDGATRLQQIRYITLPLLKPVIITLFLLQLSKIFFGNFDMFYNLTMNSAALYPTTDVIDTYVYRSLKVMGDLGMSSAAGLYQSIVGFVIVLTANAVIRKVDKDNALF
ncbi:ABC transporter permease [Robinsoniella sp. KNHs210]|uniref:ABC transporter permease n=1 Tax=Robinsoniella sp. KNHs210 TaxID=1469950 RepID=UPI000487B44F|nr:ABC transporter permease subunit [Robinsoniella sp. KNHs210]